jgi:hypothetical protein
MADAVEESRLAWQRAQAQLQMALAVLEKAVASCETPEIITQARVTVAARQASADDALHRHITQLGKS